MKQFATLLIFYFTVFFCNAQPAPDSTQVIIADIHQESFLLTKTLIYPDSSSTMPVNDVLQKTFMPLENFKARRRLLPELITYTFYLKILLNNNTDHEISGYISPGLHFTHFSLYKLNGQAIKVNNNDSIFGFRKITLAAGESGYVLARLQPLKNDINYISPLYINENYIHKYRTYVVGHKTELQIYSLVLSGVLLMMILFMITNFIISKKQEFLYNAIYSLCMFLLIFLNAALARSSSEFTNLYYSYIDFFLLFTGTIFYILFTRKFLNTKNNYPQLEKVLKYGEQFVLLLLCIYTILNFFTKSYLPQFYLENFMRVFILLIGLVFIYLAIKQKNRLLNYIAAGNAMLVLFSAISLLLLVLKIKPSSEIYLSALFYYNTGIVFELAFFLLGLTYKNRMELIRGIKEQEALKLEAGKKEFETQLTVIKAQQEERNRISADMHDDLGAGMTTISLYSELAKTKLIDTPIPEIEKISSAANELLSKMNAIIWSMSSSNDTLGNMIAYIRSYALEYFEDTGVTCKIKIPENLPNIQVIGEIRRNVFLVVKEALNNILKHAKATEVNITLIRVADGLTLYIQDNGKGINMDSIRQFGNGLKNMKKRMQDIDIDFAIENKNGTLITMHRKINTTDFF